MEEFSHLKGKILTSIQIDDRREEILFMCKSGEIYRAFHGQNCCENVSIEDIDGDVNELIGDEILIAEESTNNCFDNRKAYSNTWTFYRLSTIKASVTIRWYGESNGYYSEEVEFERVDKIQ